VGFGSHSSKAGLRVAKRKGSAKKQMSKRSGHWPIVRKMAWDRDRRNRAVCHICGQPINYDIPASSSADAWEPDHLLPVSKYPELELDLKNIAASHASCNRSRGDGELNDNDLGMRSRVW
jgi:5-methylcytosine-specific restriction endonuclease McrA